MASLDAKPYDQADDPQPFDYVEWCGRLAMAMQLHTEGLTTHAQLQATLNQYAAAHSKQLIAMGLAPTDTELAQAADAILGHSEQMVAFPLCGCRYVDPDGRDWGYCTRLRGHMGAHRFERGGNDAA